MPNTITPPQTEDIRPIRDAVDIPVPQPETSQMPLIVQIIIAILVLAAIIGLVIWLRRRAAANRIPNLRKAATAKLKSIRKLMAPETSREYTIEVSNILREFIEKRFHLPATSQTSEEFLRDLSTKNPVDLGPYKDALVHFFRQCDVGKFSSRPLSHDELKVLESSAQEVIESENTQTTKSATKPNSK